VNAAKALGMSGELRTTLGGSDANAFNQKGTPTIVMGTGMEKIHTHEEFVSRKDLVDMTRLCLEVVAQTTLSGMN
jgi:tripeptide aminopeptidase